MTAQGYTNLIVEFHSRSSLGLIEFIPPFPCSYTGLGDYAYPARYFEENIKDQPNAGWLVSLVESKPRIRDQYSFLEGKYRRLLLDTSVHTKIHAWHLRNGERVHHPAFWFADGGDEWKNQIAGD